MHFLPGFGHGPRHEPRRRHPGHHALWAAVGIAAGLLVLAGVGGALLLGRAASDRGAPRPAPGGHTIRYEVDGGSATIIYRSEAGTSRVGAVQLPWSREVGVPGDGAASVVAWDRGSGYVACRLYLDGELRAGQESSGANAVASCSIG